MRSHPGSLHPRDGALGYLVLIDLGQHSGQDEAGRGCNVQALLSQGQPVDEILEGVLEIRGQGQCLLQLCLWQGKEREREEKTQQGG